MKKGLKIIFFGTPDFAIESLDSLYNSYHELLCVVTSSDKKSGRGMKINLSEVKKYSIENDLKLLQPQSLSDEEFVTELKQYQADLFVVVAFKFLPKKIWEIPKLGTINIHASLLPNLRGAAPINWALINGLKETGLTSFFINEKIDHGDIILKQEILINDDDDFKSLYNRLSVIGSEVLLNTIKIVASGKAKIQKQDENKDLNMAPKLNARNTRINWNDNIDKILGMIRGLSPRPGSWTTLKNGDKEIRMKILKASLFSRSNFKESSIGKVLVNNDKIHIKSKDGIVNCIKIQLENKKEMLAKDLLNGYKFDENSRVY